MAGPRDVARAGFRWQVALLSLGLCLGCDGASGDGANLAAGGTDGGGHDGPGGSGGSGGETGAGGCGGSGGESGTGGEGGCPGLPPPACAPQEPVAAWLPQTQEMPRAWHGTPGFELSGYFLGRQPIGLRGEEALVLGVPSEPVPLIVGLLPVPAELGPPLSPGDEATVRFDAFFPDLLGNPSFTALRLLDAEGRLVWAVEARFDDPAPRPFAPEFETVADAPVCSFAGSADAGLALDVALGSGAPFRVEPGATVPFAGDGIAGRYLLASARRTDRYCAAPGAPLVAEASALLRIDEPGARPEPCLDDADCGEDRYCERGPTGCDAIGRCVPRPDACPRWGLVGPVCACDGRVHATACEANRAGSDASPLATGCVGVFPCGWFWCRAGEEACLRPHRVVGELPSPPRCTAPGEDLPVGEGCDRAAPTCACFVLEDPACACVEPVPGELRIECH